MPVKPRFDGDVAHLNKYAICLTHRQYTGVLELIEYAEAKWDRGEFEFDNSRGNTLKAIRVGIDKFKNAKAI